MSPRQQHAADKSNAGQHDSSGDPRGETVWILVRASFTRAAAGGRVVEPDLVDRRIEALTIAVNMKRDPEYGIDRRCAMLTRHKSDNAATNGRFMPAGVDCSSRRRLSSVVDTTANTHLPPAWRRRRCFRSSLRPDWLQIRLMSG